MMVSDIDLLLILLVVNLIKNLGHRYGSVIDAVSIAAKFAVYLTYLEEGRNLRRTGFLHHVEPRRVKEIVNEFSSLIENGGSLQMLGSAEPSYLIGISYAWMDKYPLKEGESRVKLFNLTERERILLEASLPQDIPQTLAIREDSLYKIIEHLHNLSQSYLPPTKQTAFSDALAEHAKFRLLESGTVREIKLSEGLVAYLLVKTDYSPKERQARVYTMVQDIIRAFNWLHPWVDEDPSVMRGIEVLEILPEQRPEALKEFDYIVREWANKYHTDNGQPFALQFIMGDFEE